MAGSACPPKCRSLVGTARKSAPLPTLRAFAFPAGFSLARVRCGGFGADGSAVARQPRCALGRWRGAGVLKLAFASFSRVFGWVLLGRRRRTGDGLFGTWRSYFSPCSLLGLGPQ